MQNRINDDNINNNQNLKKQRLIQLEASEFRSSNYRTFEYKFDFYHFLKNTDDNNFEKLKNILNLPEQTIKAVREHLKNRFLVILHQRFYSHHKKEIKKKYEDNHVFLNKRDEKKTWIYTVNYIIDLLEKSINSLNDLKDVAICRFLLNEITEEKNALCTKNDVIINSGNIDAILLANFEPTSTTHEKARCAASK